ncbi:hypothetical protein Nepgr_006648 [Nepenthes gracilis]|uniref:Uncharacterized protein n=1 Tax=Nepenthes gracilis TaxID=150966 RepID=A0AAD3S5J5_NEPGR|nr:hypothetical protein Nepgr_006648 [Nepenthes gracilis]
MLQPHLWVSIWTSNYFCSSWLVPCGLHWEELFLIKVPNGRYGVLVELSWATACSILLHFSCISAERFTSCQGCDEQLTMIFPWFLWLEFAYAWDVCMTMARLVMSEMFLLSVAESSMQVPCFCCGSEWLCCVVVDQFCSGCFIAFGMMEWLICVGSPDVLGTFDVARLLELQNCCSKLLFGYSGQLIY